MAPNAVRHARCAGSCSNWSWWDLSCQGDHIPLSSFCFIRNTVHRERIFVVGRNLDGDWHGDIAVTIAVIISLVSDVFFLPLRLAGMVVCLPAVVNCVV